MVFIALQHVSHFFLLLCFITIVVQSKEGFFVGLRRFLNRLNFREKLHKHVTPRSIRICDSESSQIRSIGFLSHISHKLGSARAALSQ